MGDKLYARPTPRPCYVGPLPCGEERTQICMGHDSNLDRRTATPFAPHGGGPTTTAPPLVWLGRLSTGRTAAPVDAPPHSPPPEKVPSVPLADTTLQSQFFFHVTAYWETNRHPSRGAHTACQPRHGHVADAAGAARGADRCQSVEKSRRSPQRFFWALGRPTGGEGGHGHRKSWVWATAASTLPCDAVARPSHAHFRPPTRPPPPPLPRHPPARTAPQTPRHASWWPCHWVGPPRLAPLTRGHHGLFWETCSPPLAPSLAVAPSLFPRHCRRAPSCMRCVGVGGGGGGRHEACPAGKRLERQQPRQGGRGGGCRRPLGDGQRGGAGQGHGGGVVHAGRAGGGGRAPDARPPFPTQPPPPPPPPPCNARAVAWAVPPRPARSPVACGGGRWGVARERAPRSSNGPRGERTGCGRPVVTLTAHPNRTPPPPSATTPTTDEAVGTRRGA